MKAKFLKSNRHCEEVLAPTKQSKNGTDCRATLALTLAVGTLFMLALTGCLTDNPEPGPDTRAKGREASFGLSVPGLKAPSGTRALDAAKEKEVAEIDVVIFKTADNTLLEHYRIGSSGIVAATGANDYVFKVESLENTSAITVAVIANASAETADALAAVTVGGKYAGAAKKDFLLALQVSSGAKWNTSAGGYWTIPMYGETAFGGNMYDAPVPTVQLTRMLAKVDVVNNMAPANPASPANGTFELTAVHVVNYNTKGVVAPAWNASTGTLLPTPVTTANLPAGFTPAMRSWIDGNQQTYTLSTGQTSLENEIYLFESDALSANPATPSGLRLVFEGRYTTGGVTKNYYYPADFTRPRSGDLTEYMPVLRNNSYRFTIAEVNGMGYERMSDAVASFGVMSNLRTSLLVVDESGIEQLFWNGEHFIGLSDKEVVLATAANYTEDVRCITNFAGGWQIDTSKGTAGIEYMSGSGWLSASKNGAAGDLDANLTLTTLSANTGTQRMAYVHLIAGRVTARVLVMVPPGGVADEGNAKDITTYVGAFWKANQRGERLISIPINATGYAGKWAVAVYDYGTTGFAEGDILFSAEKSTDPLAGTDNTVSMFTSSEDALHPVTNGTTWLVGDAVANGGKIEFRVGLRTRWDDQPGYATYKVRYARIVVMFGENYQHNRVMWLRQGHEPDFLMRPGDADGSGAAVVNSRSYAKKLSPYNLTVPGGSTGDVNLGAGNYGFTKYPTQAGYFFFWNGTLAMHPTNYTAQTIPGYSAWSDSREVCPTDYRHPTDGPSATLTDKIDQSEIRQSLFLTPQQGTGVYSNLNTAFGYYADGFFDRRPVHTPVVTNSTTVALQANCAVSEGADIAYQGRVVFNPYNNASLFIPHSGYRNEQNPEKYRYLGHTGYISTKTRAAEETIRVYRLSSNLTDGLTVTKDLSTDPWCMPVRCVKP